MIHKVALFHLQRGKLLLSQQIKINIIQKQKQKQVRVEVDKDFCFFLLHSDPVLEYTVIYVPLRKECNPYC